MMISTTPSRSSMGPRALYSMSASDVSSKVSRGSKWQKRPGKIVYAFNKMQALESVAHLFKPHDLIGSNNPVGGLEMIENKTSEGSFLYNRRDPTKPAIPKLATPMEVELRSVVVKDSKNHRRRNFKGLKQSS